MDVGFKRCVVSGPAESITCDPVAAVVLVLGDMEENVPRPCRASTYDVIGCVNNNCDFRAMRYEGYLPQVPWVACGRCLGLWC